MTSFRTRLVVRFVLLCAGVVALVAVWMYKTAADALRDDTDRMLRDRAYVLSKSVTPMSMRLAPWMEAFLETDKTGLRVQVVSPDGESLAQSANLADHLPLSPAAREASAVNMSSFTESIKLASGEELRMVTVPVTTYRDGSNAVIGYAQCALPEAMRGARLSSILIGLGIAVWLAAMLAWMISDLQASAWLRSINAAGSSAQTMASGDTLRERLFVPSNEEEIALLVRAFNTLLDKLDGAQGVQQRMLADASHELRTPLTVLRGEIEVALRRERPASEYREVLKSCREEIERLARITENLLSLARSDAGEGLASHELVDVSAVGHRVISAVAPLAEAKRIALTVEAPESVWVVGDAVALERVGINLVENAIRYSPAGESVTLSVSPSGDGALMTVTDTGPGIAAEHLPHLFERFYRVDKARAREHGGAGLGLAIVDSLVKAHRGSVSVSSVVGKGTSFEVRLPGPPITEI